MSQTDICIRRAVVDDASNPRAPKLCTNWLESTTLSPPRRAHHSKRRYFLWSTLMHHLRHIDTIRCKHYRASFSSSSSPSVVLALNEFVFIVFRLLLARKHFNTFLRLELRALLLHSLAACAFIFRISTMSNMHSKLWSEIDESCRIFLLKREFTSIHIVCSASDGKWSEWQKWR